MRNYIIADNQELTRFALESLLQKDEENVIYRAFDKARLVELLKEHNLAASKYERLNLPFEYHGTDEKTLEKYRSVLEPLGLPVKICRVQ